MRKIAIIVLFIISFSVTGFCAITPIIDTGTNYGGTPYGLFGGISTGEAYQWIGNEVTINENYTITGVEGFLKGSPSIPRSATVALYSDAGSLPGVELYSKAFFVGTVDGWHGVNDVSWDLSPGTYWAAFEVRTGQSYGGVYYSSAVNPLQNYAVKDNRLGVWHTFEGETALRVYAATVPVPSSLFLFGFGLLGLVGVNRKK